MEKFCIYCGNKLAVDALFCSRCGKRVATASKTEKAPAPPVKLRRFEVIVLIAIIALSVVYLARSRFQATQSDAAISVSEPVDSPATALQPEATPTATPAPTAPVTQEPTVSPETAVETLSEGKPQNAPEAEQSLLNEYFYKYDSDAGMRLRDALTDWGEIDSLSWAWYGKGMNQSFFLFYDDNDAALVALVGDSTCRFAAGSASREGDKIIITDIYDNVFPFYTEANGTSALVTLDNGAEFLLSEMEPKVALELLFDTIGISEYMISEHSSDNSVSAEQDLHDGQIISRFPENAPPLSVSFTRMDYSVSKEGGTVSCYYDLASVSDTFTYANEINSVLRQDYGRFLENVDTEHIGYISWLNEDYDRHYMHIYSGSISYLSPNYLSLHYFWEGYFGALYNNGNYGLTFNLSTGKPVSIKDLLRDPDSEILAVIQKRIFNYFGYFTDDEINNADFYRSDKIRSYTLDDFDNFGFYIDGTGNLVLCIPEYELAGGDIDSLTIMTGLYIE